MDPASSLGLASSAITLLELATKIIIKTNEIHTHGQPGEVKELKLLTRELESMHERLCRRERSMEVGSENVFQTELAIDATIDGCTAQTAELVAVLTKVTTTASTYGPPFHFAQSFQKAFKTLWERGNMQQLSQQLQERRLQLNSQIMVLLNDKMERLYSMTGEKLRRAESLQADLRNGQKKILEAMTFTEDPSLNSFTGSDKPVAVILTFDDGSIETMNRQAPKNPAEGLPMEPKDSRTQAATRIETTTTFRAENNSFPGQNVTVEYAPLARTILDSLYFKAFREREERVAEAHEKTFQWILNDREFIDFLDHDRDFYWITGKPGSGKSTLVKFIHQQSSVRQRLLRWSGNQTLVLSPFYFWHAGTNLQKSQTGLLRSMLLSILSPHQHLIPTAFPELCRLYNEIGRIESDLSLSELKAGFLRLTSGTDSGLKFCFLIDGLDEYSGEHSELCDFLIRSARSPRIKFLVASRPWGIFSEAFDKYPFIRMQDLTQGDISDYVEDALMRYLLRRPDQEEEIHELIRSVTERAAGVFLWVILVVRELRRGLQSHDDISDLHRRLDAFPTDLKEYYRYMYDRIDVIHRPRCSKILLTLLRTKELPVQGLLSVMQMSFSESETLESALSAPLRRVGMERWLAVSNDSKQQIENKTLGLVDVAVPPAESCTTSTSHIMCADFLHRTVYDFFLLEGLQEEMKAEVPRGFDPSTTLLACYVVEIKAFPSQKDTFLEHDRIVSDAMNCLRAVRCLELQRQIPWPDVMNCIDMSMTHYWSSIKVRRGDTDQLPAGPTTWAQAVVTEMYKIKWSQVSPYIFSRAHYFLFLSVLSGCVLSVASRTRPGTNVTNEERSQILSMLIFRYFNDPLREDGNYQACSDIENGKSNFVTAIGLLLEHGADPGTLGILSATDEKATGQGISHHTGLSIAQGLRRGMTYFSSWDYFQDHVAQTIQDELSRDLWRNDPESRDLALLTAINHLRILQHFLGANVNVTEKVERVLEQLNQSVSQPLAGHGHFEREYLDQFTSEYQRTRDMMRKKRMVFVKRPRLRAWWDLQRVMAQEAIGGSFSNVIILILLLIIAYLTSVP